jgi:hypothetical protein
MGARARAMYDQAQNELADAVVNVFAEEFCRGSDSLGPRGWDILAAALRTVAEGFSRAASMCEAHGEGPEAHREGPWEAVQ